MGPRVSKRRRGNIKLDVPLTGAVTHTALIGGGEGKGRAERAGRGGGGGRSRVAVVGGVRAV